MNSRTCGNRFELNEEMRSVAVKGVGMLSLSAAQYSFSIWIVGLNIGKKYDLDRL